MLPAVAAVIGIFAGGLTVMLGVQIAANKYIRGDCFKPSKEDEEDGEEAYEKTTSSTTTPEPYTPYSSKGASGEIQSSGFSGGQFASKAVLVFSLTYFKETKRIVGAIKRVQNWDRKAEDAPKFIRFSVKTAPKNKHSTYTSTISVKKDTLALSFAIGPIEYEELLTSSLCIKMYGKAKRIGTKWKCYGECYVTLDGVHGKDGAVDLMQKIMPKAVYLKKEKSSKKKDKNNEPTTTITEESENKEEPIEEETGLLLNTSS